MDWQQLTAKRLGAMRGNDIPLVGGAPGTISFAGGSPASELFPLDAFAQVYADTIRAEGSAGLQYGASEGVHALRADIAASMTERGTPVEPDEVVIVSGALQGLDMVGRLLLDPGDSIIVDGPTFLGALLTFNAYQPRYLVVPTDEYGAQVEEIAALLAAGERPKFIYTLSTFHNPAGVTMTTTRRRRLLELSAEYGVPILEDDPYNEIWFDEAPPATLKALPGGEQVIHLSTFSKTLAPGLRLGWLVCPRDTVADVVLCKRGADLHTDQMLQRVVHNFLASYDMPAHIAGLRAAYRERCNLMLEALERHVRPDVTWTRPGGGFFVWLEMPIGADSVAMAAEAAAAGVSYYPGPAFFANGAGANTFRLAFSQASPAQIEDGVSRLAGVIDQHLNARGIDPTPVRVRTTLHS